MTNHFKNLLHHIPDLRSRHILDLGCGKGSFLIEAAYEGAQIIGSEINPIYIKEAEKECKEAGVNVQILNSAGESLPFEKNTFGFVNMAEVIEHVENPIKVMTEVFRVLEEDGLVYLSVPSRFGLFDPHYHIFGINLLPRPVAEWAISLVGKSKDYQDKSAGRQRLSDMHYYKYSQIEALLQEIGFYVHDSRLYLLQERVSGKCVTSIVIALYKLIRPFYPQTFHLLLKKGSEAHYIRS